MEFHCNYCGYQARFGLGMAPYNQRCEVCRIGYMQPGVTPSGFRFENQQLIRLTAPGEQVQQPYVPAQHGEETDEIRLDFFCNEGGDRYRRFIREETVYVGKFNNLFVPDPKRFAWLSPYTGNKHNRTHFTQLVLANVAMAQFRATGRFPRLIEPFIGSGQVFLHASTWGTYFNQGISLFHKVIGGDLNPYVIKAYEILRVRGQSFVDEYLEHAVLWDQTLDDSFHSALMCLDYIGGPTTAKAGIDANTTRVVMSYIYLVNRCVRGSKLKANLGLHAKLRTKNLDLLATRARERSTLTQMVYTISLLGEFSIGCRDFEETCKLAVGTDIVFMDCPFPNFTKLVPATDIDHPELLSETADTYGVGDDGAALQARIVKVAGELVAKGTTVIICNFANPALVRAYAKILATSSVPAQYRRWFTFTYRSPSRVSEAYQLTILPGHNAFPVYDVPDLIRKQWIAVGGDDNFDANVQEYFDWQVDVALTYQQRAEVRAIEDEQNEMDVDYVPSGDEDSEDSDFDEYD